MAGAHRSRGRPDGIELIVPDWFYKAVLDDARPDHRPAYFDLTGGLDRWLYRIVRKHGGRQRDGWRFDFATSTSNPAACRRSSASPSSCATSCAASRCPAILSLEVEIGGRTLLAFEPLGLWKAVDGLVLSGTRLSCHREPEARAIRNPNRP
jgi:hypothetical protein